MRHSFEMPLDVCDHCGRPHCRTCLVWALGADRPPLCVGCALARSGVRHAKVKAMAPRHVRRARQELQAFLASAPPPFEALPDVDGLAPR